MVANNDDDDEESQAKKNKATPRKSKKGTPATAQAHEDDQGMDGAVKPEPEDDESPLA